MGVVVGYINVSIFGETAAEHTFNSFSFICRKEFNLHGRVGGISRRNPCGNT